MSILTDGITGPNSGTEPGNKAYNVCFFYDWNGSRTLTIDLDAAQPVTAVKYFSSNNGGGGVLPPTNFKITLFPSGEVIVDGASLSAGWNTFSFEPKIGVEQVRIQLTKQSGSF